MSTVKQILNSKGNGVFTISSDTNAMEALKIMDDKGFGMVLVVDDTELEGIFTEGDYISRVLLKGLDKSKTLVKDVMTSNVQTINPNQTVNDTMQIMIDEDIRYFPAVEDGQLIGVISVGDCIKQVIAEQEEIIEQMEHYIHG